MIELEHAGDLIDVEHGVAIADLNLVTTSMDSLKNEVMLVGYTSFTFNRATTIVDAVNS